MHPDKLAQKGKKVTPEDQAKFQRMKEAYEVLSDPHKRETYDAIGERGMKWLDDPLSIDPQEIANNFANSSFLDRSKIFSIFLFLAVAVLIQPLLICLQVDGKFGDESRWTTVLTPLWMWNTFILFYHTRVIMMGKIPRPDHIPEEDWKDPLPMKTRITSLVRFLLFFAFEIQLALHLDGVNSYSWIWVLAPLFVLEVFTLFRKWPDSRLVIITLDELQSVMGKPYTEFTQEEKNMVEKSYLLVPDRDGSPYDAARKIIRGARIEVGKVILRLVFMMLVMFKLDRDLGWSWWLVFTPFFVGSVYVCWGNLQGFSEVQVEVEEKLKRYDVMNENVGVETTQVSDYGAMEEGECSKEADETPVEPSPRPLTEEEKEEINARLARSGAALLTTCCAQIITLILLCLILSKMEGAGFSSVWIISPFLLFVSIMLCILGCMIFCVSPIDENEMMFDPQNAAGSYFNMDSHDFVPSTSHVPAPHKESTIILSEPPSGPTTVASTTATATTMEHVMMPTSTLDADPTTTGMDDMEETNSKNNTKLDDNPEPRNSVLKDAEEQKQQEEDDVENVDAAPVMAPAVAPALNVDFLDCDPHPSDELQTMVPTPSEVDDLD